MDIPLFRGLSSAQASDVFARGRTIQVPPKVRLCTPDQKAKCLFLLLSGKVKYSRETASGEEILIRLVTPFECFGLAAVLPSPPNYVGSAEPVVVSELVVWNHAEILEIADNYAPIRINVLRIALDYYGSLCDRHAALFEDSASHRIARVLIDLGRRSNGIHSEGVDVQITNEQVGALADVGRFTVSRVLSDWNKRGVISKKRESVRIHSPEALLSDSDADR